MAVNSVGEKKKYLDCDDTSSKAFLTEPTLSLERSKLGKFILFDQRNPNKGKGKREKRNCVVEDFILDSIRF